jgi:hypothetical protein
VGEDVNAAVLGLNEAEALLGVKPTNCDVGHDALQVHFYVKRPGEALAQSDTSAS